MIYITVIERTGECRWNYSGKNLKNLCVIGAQNSIDVLPSGLGYLDRSALAWYFVDEVHLQVQWLSVYF